ncbi:hypothetical protein NJR55_13675, partial [Idiomarina sp. M1R2S28]
SKQGGVFYTSLSFRQPIFFSFFSPVKTKRRCLISLADNSSQRRRIIVISFSLARSFFDQKA